MVCQTLKGWGDMVRRYRRRNRIVQEAFKFTILDIYIEIQGDYDKKV